MATYYHHQSHPFCVVPVFKFDLAPVIVGVLKSFYSFHHHVLSLISSGCSELTAWRQRPGREADFSLACGIEVRNRWRFTSTTSVCLHAMLSNYIFVFIISPT
jgi:hypothetical protein